MPRRPCQGAPCMVVTRKECQMSSTPNLSGTGDCRAAESGRKRTDQAFNATPSETSDRTALPRPTQRRSERKSRRLAQRQAPDPALYDPDKDMLQADGVFGRSFGARQHVGHAAGDRHAGEHPGLAVRLADRSVLTKSPPQPWEQVALVSTKPVECPYERVASLFICHAPERCAWARTGGTRT